MREVKLYPVGWVFAVFVTAFLAVGMFNLFAQTLPYEKMKRQIANFPLGTGLQEAKAQITRRPEISCSSVAECKTKLKLHYDRYAPDPASNIRGPVLVYRMAGMSRIHCLYFDRKNRLSRVAESALK